MLYIYICIVYMYVCMYMYIYMYIYIYIYICNHENNVPSRLSCTSCAQVHELPQSHCGDNRGGGHCFHDCIYITLILLL